MPAPDYPLWTAAVSLSVARGSTTCAEETAGYRTRRYPQQDHASRHAPSSSSIRNNPTGALYPGQHSEAKSSSPASTLIIYADEVYASSCMAERRIPGYCVVRRRPDDHLQRLVEELPAPAVIVPAGWSFPATSARRRITLGLMLASVRASVRQRPGRHGIQTALGGYQSIDDLVGRAVAWLASAILRNGPITAIPGVTPRRRRRRSTFRASIRRSIRSGERSDFIAELLQEARVLLVRGRVSTGAPGSFPAPVFLPHEDDLRAGHWPYYYSSRASTQAARSRPADSSWRRAGRRVRIGCGARNPCISSCVHCRATIARATGQVFANGGRQLVVGDDAVVGLSRCGGWSKTPSPNGRRPYR